MRLLLVFARGYPGRTLAVVACMLLAALADRIYSIEDTRARRIHPGQAPVAPAWAPA